MATPELASSFEIPGDVTPFQRCYVQLSGLASDNAGWSVVMMTLEHVVSPLHQHVYPIPRNLSAQTALLSQYPNSESSDPYWMLRLSPIEDPSVLYTLDCAYPDRGECTLAVLSSVAIPPPPSGAPWRDLTFFDGVSAESSELNVVLVSDSSLARLRCAAVHCKFIDSLTLASLSADVAKFPHLVGVVNAIGAAGEASGAFVFLSPVATAQVAQPVLMLALTFEGGSSSSSHVSTSALSLWFGPGAVNYIVAAGSDLAYLLVTQTGQGGVVTMWDFALEKGGQAVHSTHTLALRAGEELVPGGMQWADPFLGNNGVYPVFMLTATADGLALYAGLVDADVENDKFHSNFTRPVDLSGLTAGVLSYYDTTSTSHGMYDAIVGATNTSTGEASVLVFQTPQFGSSSSSSLDFGSEIRERNVVRRARVRVSDLSSPCTDATQPPICLISCAGPPSEICGPSTEPPAGYRCFVMPSQMDACNNCPAQYSNVC